MSRGGAERFVIEEALPEDDGEIRALLRESPMGERIRLAFEREPSFFAAAGIGGRPMVGVLRDRGRVIGIGTRTLAPVYQNGVPTPHGYLSDLRLAEAYRGGWWLARGYRVFRDWHADGATKLYHSVIFSDNGPALRVLAANRRGMPCYRDLGKIHCPAVLLGRREPEYTGELDVRAGDPASLPEIVDCLNRNQARRQFAPVHRAEDFPGLRRGLQAEHFRVARRAGRIVGVAAMWDQSAFKQTRVQSVPVALRLLSAPARWCRRLFGTPAVPESGRLLSFFHLSFVAIDDDDQVVFRALLRRVYNDGVAAGYAHFVAGFHERDPLATGLDSYAKIGFEARFYCVHFEDGARAFAALDNRPPHVETGLL